MNPESWTKNFRGSLQARAFIEKYWENIVDKWVSFFVYKKRVRCTDIKKKL